MKMHHTVKHAHMKSDTNYGEAPIKIFWEKCIKTLILGYYQKLVSDAYQNTADSQEHSH